MTYHPERSIAELRNARDHGDESYAQMFAICARAAERVKVELWPDPADREQAGLGAIVAAASLSKFAEPGRDAPLMNAVGMFGLALVEAARAESGVRS